MYILSNKQIGKSLKGMHPNSRVAKKITDIRSSLEDDPELVMSAPGIPNNGVSYRFYNERDILLIL